MTANHTTDDIRAARLDRSDLVHTEDGTFSIPVLLEEEDGEARVCLTIGPSDAARLHAQLDRLLNRGWAMSEVDKAARQQGNRHTIGGSAV